MPTFPLPLLSPTYHLLLLLSNSPLLSYLFGFMESNATFYSATLNLIDEAHANAPRKWLEDGAPAYPTQSQLETYDIASRLTPSKLNYVLLSSDSVEFNLNLLPQAVAFISLGLQ